MSKVVGGLFGGGQQEKLKRLQEEQAAKQAKHEADLAAIEAGQKALRDGGKRGQLAFLDDLARELGGGAGGNTRLGG